MALVKILFKYRTEALLYLAVLALALVTHIITERSLQQQQDTWAPDMPAASESRGGRLFADNDSYTWLSLAKQTVSESQWRINFTHADNTPYGRETHWCSLLVWLLVAGGAIVSLFSDLSIYAAIEQAGFFINLCLLLLLMAGWILCMRRLLGLWPTWLGLLLLLWLPDMRSAFFSGRPDHQTLHCIASLLSLCLLIRGGLGWTTPPGSTSAQPLSPPPLAKARLYFRLSGLTAALGIWAGSTVQVSLLVLLGIGILLGLYSCRDAQDKRPYHYHSVLWIQWAGTGAIFTVLFYLIQYFPSDMAMRLETIHPAYAISWLGGGIILSLLTRWIITGDRPSIKRPLLWIAIATLPVYPALVFLGPLDWHCLRDPLLKNFQGWTSEGQPFYLFYETKILSSYWALFTIFPILALLSPLLLKSTKVDTFQKTALLLCLVCLYAYGACAWFQVRWTMFASLLLIATIPLALSIVLRHFSPRTRSIGIALIALALLPMTWSAGRDLVQRSKGTQTDPGLLYSLWPQRIAKALDTDGNAHTLQIITRPEFASGLYYFASIKTVGSVFWQNRPGLADCVDFFLAKDEAAALAAIQNRDVDIVAVYQIETAEFYERMRYGADLPIPTPNFLDELKSTKPKNSERLSYDEALSGTANHHSSGPIEAIIKANIYRIENH